MKRLLQTGIIESELGRYHQAIDTLTRHLDKVLYDRKAYFERAVAYTASQELVNATQVCIQFVKAHSSSEIAQILVPELKELVNS